MGKVSKFSNIYSTDGEILRHVDEETGTLKNYTTEELEQLVDKLGEDKDENGEVRNKQAFMNAQQMLMQYYMRYGNPHEEEIKAKLEEYAKQRGIEEQVQKAMDELKEELIEEPKTQEDMMVDRAGLATTMDEYIEYEEVA